MGMAEAAALAEFRRDWHACLERRADALFELTDAVLCADGPVVSLPELSLTAYISYNVYPGWKSKEIVRDAMLLASRSSATPDEKVRSARRMVDFLQEVAPDHTPLASVVAEFRSP